ncbi:uncharacterized mitochondrial protein-like protein, partial [Tanacetum coccineum]
GYPTINRSSETAALFKSTVQQLEAFGPSFALNLFKNGFTFGNIDEDLKPYNLHAKGILRCVEHGHFPTGIIRSNTSWKYVNGTVLCAVCDYRATTITFYPNVKTVPLKMPSDDIIEDTSFNNLTQDEKLILESRALLALNPRLNLDLTATPDHFSETARVIDLGIDWANIRTLRRKLDNEPNQNVVGSEIAEVEAFEDEWIEPEGNVVEDDNEITSDRHEEDVTDSGKQDNEVNKVPDESSGQLEDHEAKDDV